MSRRLFQGIWAPVWPQSLEECLFVKVVYGSGEQVLQAL